MTLHDVIQLAFGLSNGLSFALTFRHAAWAKIAGSCVLLVAHPGIAVYFLATHQPFFLVGNAIMTAAGLYGLVRGLRALRRERENRYLAAMHWKGYGDGERLLSEALRRVAEDVLAKRVDNTPR